MLGRIMGWDRWTWSAFGKHPSALDYFQTDLSSPLTQAFAQWVAKGFKRIPEAGGGNTMVAWRFWSRGAKRKLLICGLAKSSSDGVGRSYPLILMGEGGLNLWEAYWHLLPFVLDPTWEKLEYLAARRIDRIDQLESGLRRMPAPAASWEQWQATVSRDPRSQEMVDRAVEDIQKHSCSIFSEEKVTVPLVHREHDEQMRMAGAWNLALKNQCMIAPSTVFIGGSPEHTHIVFFNRPLMADDFADLWSVL